MARVAANADKPKGYEPSPYYRFSRNPAELSYRSAGLPRGHAPRGWRSCEAAVRGVGMRRIRCAPGRKGAR